MGVVPVGASAIAHFEVVLKRQAWGYCAGRMSIHLGRCVQTMPMNDGRLGQFIAQRDFEVRTTFQAQYGVLVRFAGLLCLVKQEG